MTAIGFLGLVSCGRVQVSEEIDALPEIFPDYQGVTIPCNIAPLNFSYLGEEPCVLLASGRQVKGKNGRFTFKRGLWKRLVASEEIRLTVAVRQNGRWKSYKPFTIKVSSDKIDPYVSYRLIPPGYQGWKHMGLFQRNLENYDESAILTNDLTGENCLNCHTPCQRDPSRFVFHARAGFGGTILVNDGEIEKLDTKTDSTISALVYPCWHPSGKYIAFSVNKTLQSFFNHDPNRIEVYDEASDVVVYDIESHNIAYSPLTRSKERFETFPTFSSDGKTLYFCSAAAVDSMPDNYARVKYAICSLGFNPDDLSFGDSVQVVYDAPAVDKSASYPYVSPDGRFLAFTRQSYGNFPIWHKDADLWMMDLRDGRSWALDELNSDDADSYHSWSGNSRWLLFSSRRDDGLYTKPYIAHIDENGHASKPFLLPQRSPLRMYKNLMYSYNRPELMRDKVTLGKHRLASRLRNSEGMKLSVK